MYKRGRQVFSLQDNIRWIEDVDALLLECFAGGFGVTGNALWSSPAASGPSLPALRADTLLLPAGAEAPV